MPNSVLDVRFRMLFVRDWMDVESSSTDSVGALVG